MSRFLVESDLNIDRALNLDGGASTGLLLSEPAEGIAAFALLPVVIVVYLR
jgi:pyruvate/2-oxoacid:ferredoxin oxidoreductase alpha subunit